MIFSSLIALFAAVVAAQAIPFDEAKAPFAAEAVEGFGRCGGCWNPSCLNPVVHFQNYQDINMNVAEYYNFKTSFPLLVGDSYGWTITNEGYMDGEFQMLSGSPVFLERNSPVLLENQDITYISAQLDYINSVDPDSVIDSPLGAGGDPFYAAAFFSAVDNDATGLEYAFALTNTTVFAIYGRSNVTQTPENDCITFRYLVPIQSIRPNSIYTLVFNKEDGSVSWMIDGTIRMVIPISGKLIDEKFLIDSQGGSNQTAAFPNSVSIAIGGDKLYTGVPHTACQDAIFQYCDRTQNIFHADNVQCVYEPIQETETFFSQLMTMSLFSITQATAMKPACSCPC